MTGLSLIISIVALIFAYLAYQKSGGSADELKQKVEDIGLTTESLRNKTADILERLEKRVRGEDKKAEGQPEGKNDMHQDA